MGATVRATDPGVIPMLLDLLDEGFDRRAWHGPNLLGALRGVSPEQAAWRPAPGRHNIRELVVHCAYWKYMARRRLTGDSQGRFPLPGSNWFVRDDVPAPREWKAEQALLRSQHRELRETVAGLPADSLDNADGADGAERARMIRGVALHDIYHAGQILLLKRLSGR